MLKPEAPGTASPFQTTLPTGQFRVTLTVHLISLACIAVAVFLAYSNSLHGTWAFDDTAISQNNSIEENLNLRLGYRKIAYLSFLVNKWINPLDPVNYRLSNIAIHVVNAALVYWLAFLTLRLPGMRERFARYSYPVALLTTAVFALHPVNINAVSYIVQRMTALSAMFVLLGLISYIYGRTYSFRYSSAPLYVLAALFVFLGIFSKENAIMALPLMVLYDYFFISCFEKTGLLRKTGLGVAALLIVITAASVYLDFSKAAGVLVGQFLHLNEPMTPLGWSAVDVYWTPLQHILTEFRVIAGYLFLLLAPLPKYLLFDNWGLVPSKSLTDPLSTLFAFALIAGLLLFSILRSRKMPFLAFGLLWYLTAISLESFIAIGSDFYFEHRNYLPVTGLFFGIIAQSTVSLKDILLKQRVVWTAALVLAAVLGGLTYQRNFVWKDSVTLWTDTVSKAPQNLRAAMALGNAYLKDANFPSAARYYSGVLKHAVADKRPQYFHDAAYSLGMVHLFLGNLGQAKKIIDLMDARLAGNPATDVLRGFYSSLSGDTEAALGQLNQSLSAVTGHDSVIVYTLLGDTYRRRGQADKALESYRQALKSDPSFAAAYYGMGNVYLTIKDIGNAEKLTGQALALDPANPLALAQMADIILIKKGPLEAAKQYAERALASSPPFYQPYATMGMVLVMLGRDADADVFFQRAQTHGLRGYMLPFTRARAYFMKGDKKKAAVYLREIAGMKDAPAELKQIISKDLDRL